MPDLYSRLRWEVVKPGPLEVAVFGPWRFLAQAWVATAMLNYFEVWHQRVECSITDAKDACEEQLDRWLAEIRAAEAAEPLLALCTACGPPPCASPENCLGLDVCACHHVQQDHEAMVALRGHGMVLDHDGEGGWAAKPYFLQDGGPEFSGDPAEAILALARRLEA